MVMRDLGSVILLILFAIINVKAQVVDYGTSLEVYKKWNLPRAWSISIGPALEFRPLHTGYLGEESETGTAPPALRNLDLNFGVERRWLERWEFGSAIRIRRRYAFSNQTSRELRTWLYAEHFGDIRYTRTLQRFRTEQRWRAEVDAPLELTYRHRYFFGIEHAISGLVADPGEWVWIAQVELLLSTRRLLSDARAVDVRPYFGLARDRLELGLESRHEKVLDGATSHAVLLVVQRSL